MIGPYHYLGIAFQLPISRCK